MNKIFIYVFLVISIVINSLSTAQAQDVTYITQPPTFELAEPMNPSSDSIPSGASITPVRVGDRARLDGVLYSLEANAWLLSEIERLQQFWILEMNSRVNLTLAWANHELESQANRTSASLEFMQLRLDARNRDVEALSQINTNLQRQARRNQRRTRLRMTFIVLGTGIVTGVAGYGIGRITP